MQEKASEQQIDAVIQRLVELGFEVHRSTGTLQTVLGAVGSRGDFDIRDIEVLDGVKEVHRISSPYKLVARTFRPEGTVVKLRNGVDHRRRRRRRHGRALLGRIARATVRYRRTRLEGRRSHTSRRRIQAAQLALLVSGDGRRRSQAAQRSWRKIRAAGHQRGHGDFRRSR